MQQGKCSNFGNCDKADSREVLQIPDGQELVCPVCHQQLTPVYASGGRSGSPARLIGIALLLIVLIGGGLLVKGLFGGKAPSSTTPGDGTKQPGQTAPGTGTPSAPPATGAPIILRLHGSNTIGSQLAPALAEAFLKKKGASSVQTQDLPADHPGDKPIDKLVIAQCPPGTFPEGDTVAIEVRAHGSATAFTDLEAGTCDIGCASRKIKPEEENRLRATGLGDMTSLANEHVLGLDGIAVFVRTDNPIQALTKDQIAAIFSGKVTNWSQIGGASVPISLYARDDNSGTYDTFKSLVLGNAPLGPAKRFEDSAMLVSSVAQDPGGIGFVSLTFVREDMPIKTLAVGEGAAARKPTIFTVQTEDYLLSRRLYLYTPQNTKPLVGEFVAFALSDAGQEIVKDTGFVGQQIPQQVQLPQPPPMPADAPAEYRALVRGATRLPFNFRFKTGSDQLDNKAVVDLDRLERWVTTNKKTSANIILIGFADGTGTESANLVLSRSRAASVATELNKRGINPAVAGFGSKCRIAVPEKTDDDRARNRRVEIWVRM